MNRPSRVEITESSPRDGLQSLGAFIPTEAKIGLIDSLALAGLVGFDAVSFVSPAAVPQMADAAEVMAGVARDRIRLSGLVPNKRGLEAALAAGVDGVGVLATASDTFSLRNVNADVAGAMERIRGILDEVPDGLIVRGYVSTATHCPYEGPTDPGRVAHLAETLVEWGCDEVFLGETLGRGTVGEVEPLLEKVLAVVPVDRIGVHFHDTYGQALANLVVSLDAGVARLDSSAGGLGGCPYAPGAAGNVATEDVMWLLDGLGIDHDGDVGNLARAAARFCEEWKLPYQSRAGRALLSAERGSD
ncbi:MAG TPA: hydroxymethylglutaryl-CoA lyase [Acidimicrobiia bacterium]|nr:hydroxymethylglutaryl-CoA lyase [Acidimicrobiia bacterium]